MFQSRSKRLGVSRKSVPKRNGGIPLVVESCVHLSYAASSEGRSLRPTVRADNHVSHLATHLRQPAAPSSGRSEDCSRDAAAQLGCDYDGSLQPCNTVASNRSCTATRCHSRPFTHGAPRARSIGRVCAQSVPKLAAVLLDSPGGPLQIRMKSGIAPLRESTGLVSRTVFKTAEAFARGLVGSIPTLSRHKCIPTRNDSEQREP